jgi:hypothetical protein
MGCLGQPRLRLSYLPRPIHGSASGMVYALDVPIHGLTVCLYQANTVGVEPNPWCSLAVGAADLSHLGNGVGLQRPCYR